jgi:septum formation protein
VKYGKKVFSPPDGLELILASVSPSRSDLLIPLVLEKFSVEVSDIDESINNLEAPKKYAARIALKKAETIKQRHSGSIVLAADTVVACGTRVLDKPETITQAEKCLHKLSGRSHKVLGAFVLIGSDNRYIKRLVVSSVTFKRLDKQEIRNYLDGGEWNGKAGGYAIQGRAAAFVKKIQGSYSNVVGLPLHDVYNALVGIGFHYKDLAS